jgi:hypothetical protein
MSVLKREELTGNWKNKKSIMRKFMICTPTKYYLCDQIKDHETGQHIWRRREMHTGIILKWILIK